MITEFLRLLVAHKRDKYTFNPYSPGEINFETLPEKFGLYLHIPFCRSLCPFCPYNKVQYNKQLAEEYYKALQKELGFYKHYLRDKQIESIYIGGGTPTLMLKEISGLLEVLRQSYDFHGDIGIEVHPREATPEILTAVKQAGINMVSIGVQTFNPTALAFLQRGYGAEDSHRAVRNAVAASFDTVDVDLMYNIPGQSLQDILADMETCLTYGVNQVSNYPLILFPLTPLQTKVKESGQHRFGELEEYKIQKELHRLALTHGYKRTSIWTYAKKEAKRYTSVTRETFLGLGVSATSLFGNYFYINTFSVPEYIKAVTSDQMPISLVNHMTGREKQVFWLFWRCYDTVLSRSRFRTLFNSSLDKEFPLLIALLKLMGLAKDHKDSLKLTTLGAFCYHFVEKQYSLRYLNDLWSASMQEPWPKRLEL